MRQSTREAIDGWLGYGAIVLLLSCLYAIGHAF